MDDDIMISTMIAKKYGLQFDVVNLHKEYWENVVGYAKEKVMRGLTPNPDVMCNKLIKFGMFEERVGYQYDFTATGHYARAVREGGLTWLCTAPDPVKDQTDFLSQLSQKQIAKSMFPIGDMMKSEVRRIAQESRLPSAYRKDSQGICFLGKFKYNDFLKNIVGEKDGNIVDRESGQILGKHKGFWYHTIGQRKGLGLSGGPWFVVDKDIDDNVVYVSRCEQKGGIYGNNFTVTAFNHLTLSEHPWKAGEVYDIKFKIRHTEMLKSGKLRLADNGIDLNVESSEPIQGIAPGQFGVIYDEEGNKCYGSGEIRLLL
jgi:tRNA-specific 2-thiouridylase